jgi:hypothetical protein
MMQKRKGSLIRLMLKTHRRLSESYYKGFSSSYDHLKQLVVMSMNHSREHPLDQHFC